MKEWGNRVAAAGYRLVYGSDDIVRHPARPTIRKVFKKSIRDVSASEQVMAREGIGLLHPAYTRLVFRYLSPPVRFAARLWRDQTVEGLTNKSVVLLIHVLDKYVRLWARFGAIPTR
jgi:hypothetical protein